MKIHIFCGKGGVGKTNSAVSLALYLSVKGEKAAIVDYDGGHSVTNTLGITKDFRPNVLHFNRPNLDVVIVENADYIGIAQSKAEGGRFEEYLKQFPGDLGLIPLADMVNAFFGVPTDVSTLQKFTTLVTILKELEDRNYDRVIIDVEPTAGFERLLSNAHSTMNSLLNLKKKGILTLALLGAKWPEIASYLKGEYIKNADRYVVNIERTVRAIKEAVYLIVSTPEASPVAQTFEVRKIIEKFGGNVHGYLVNNIRGENYEQENIARLEREKLPVIRVNRQAELHGSYQDRIPILTSIGKIIAHGLLCD